jgi:perosamine synthetase
MSVAQCKAKLSESQLCLETGRYLGLCYELVKTYHKRRGINSQKVQALQQLRVPIHRPTITKQDIEFVAEKLGECQVSGRAPVVNEFENSFAAYLGVRHAVAVSSGTAALHVAMLACGVTSGDRVVEPSLTMMSTAFAASYIGAEVLPVDVEASHWCIDPQKLAEVTKDRPKAVVAVHLYGIPARVDEIEEFARKNKMLLIEDCAEALGTRFNGRPVGTYGDVATFSFFSNKLITTGEGGMIATNSQRIAARARSLRDLSFGKKNKFVHDRLGYSYRMSAMQASLGLSQLRRAEDIAYRKRTIGEAYHRDLQGTPLLQLHPERPGNVSIPWMYSVLVKGPIGLRDKLMRDLANSGIETRPFFVPIHQQPVYSRRIRRRVFPISEDLSRRGLNLPSSLDLSEREIESIATAVKSGLRAESNS